MVASYPLAEAKGEVRSCIDVWKGIFERHFGDVIEYAYAKGSCVKDWESPIDYVPVLSDVDIHVKLWEGRSLFEGIEQPFKLGLDVSAEYEEEFLRIDPEPLHVPRTQIVILNPHFFEPDFFLPSHIPAEDVMIGEPKPGPPQPAERVRASDLKALMTLEEDLRCLPVSILDRSGIDLVVLIRRLNWLISSTPIRLLSQVQDPEEAWHLNRTRACEMLRKQGFQDVAEEYEEYYLTGWEAFRTDFRDDPILRRLLSRAYSVLERVHAHAVVLE